MEELLKKAKFNNPKIKAVVARAVAKNLSELSKPCFYPDVKKHFYEFLTYTGLTEDDIRAFTKRRWVGRKEAKFSIQSDHISNFYIFMMQYYLTKNRDQKTYQYFMIFYMIRQYANLMWKHFPRYCKPEHFNYALEHLTKTHLFAREKTIANALYFLANAMVRIWTNGIKTNNLDQISRFMQDSRTRISQSLKSFASAYYKAEKEGAGIATAETPSDDEETYEYEIKEKPTTLIYKTIEKMTVYKVIDRKAVEDARKLSKINAVFADIIVKSLNNVKFTDNMRIVYQLFIKDLPNVKTLCGPNFIKYVRSLMSIKRTSAKIYFKQQIEILLLGVLKESKEIARYDRLTSQTKFLINLFLAFYITMYMRNSVC